MSNIPQEVVDVVEDIAKTTSQQGDLYNLYKFHSVVIQQAIGGTGSSSYIQNIDDTGTYTYVGLAIPTSLSSQAVWQIKRIDTSGNIRFAGGLSTFEQVWDNRASLSYS